VGLSVFFVTARNISMGLAVVVTEVFIGSFGHLLGIAVGRFMLSLRMMLFLSFFLGVVVWCVGRAGEWKELFRGIRRTLLQFPWLSLFIVGAVLGVLRALQLHNDRARIVDDANQWVFLCVLMVLPWALKTHSFPRLIATLYRVSMVALGIATLLILYIFTHDSQLNIAISVFRWARDTRLSEITLLSSSFSRVFLQSQVLLLPLWLSLVDYSGKERIYRKRFLSMLILVTSVLLVSLSRSFWVGMVVGVVALGIVRLRESGAKILWPLGRTLFIGFGGALIVIWATIHFPFPLSTSVSLTDTLLERTTTLNEAATASRWSLLPALWEKVKLHPLMGSGFGATVTYKSQDPRIIETNPTGEYTTHAFEWGVLDFWYKFGIVGIVMLGALLIWVYTLFRKNMVISSVSIVTLLAVHTFTPYLNHPLGFVYLLLITIAQCVHQDISTWCFDTQNNKGV